MFIIGSGFEPSPDARKCVRVRLQAEHFVQAGDAQPKSPLSTSPFFINIQKIIPSLSNNERMKMQSAADFLRCLIQQLGECDCVKRATEETRQALFSPFQFTVQVGTCLLILTKIITNQLATFFPSK